LSLYYVFYHEAHEEKLFFNSDLRALRGEVFFAILTDSKSAICDRVEYTLYFNRRWLMANLKRKQIYLDDESNRALKRLALTTKISEAEHIRKAVKNYIAKQKDRMAEEDPLWKLIGLCDKPDSPTDASIYHDRYLYGKQV
jgi:hypothetical protein